MNSSLKWAVFLDRDGVINQEVNHLSHPDQLSIIPGAINAISSLNQQSIPVIVITNQAGVARGYFTEDDISKVHLALQNILKQENAFIDKFYYCPHHPEFGNEIYKISCQCRKPESGMLRQASQDLGLILERSYLIGDKSSDIQAGYNVGCKTALVMTGHGMKEITNYSNSFASPHFVAPSIVEAVRWILEQECSG